MDQEECARALICDLHHEETILLSPCRYKCALCTKKTVHGYSNPDHVSNPFGYLYLVPELCNSCALRTQVCRWCIQKKE